MSSSSSQTPFTIHSLMQLVSQTFISQCVCLLSNIQGMTTQNPSASLVGLLVSTNQAQVSINDYIFDFSSIHFLSDRDVDYLMDILDPHPGKITFFRILLAQMIHVPTRVAEIVERMLRESDFDIAEFFQDISISTLRMWQPPTNILRYLYNLHVLHQVGTLLASTSTGPVPPGEIVRRMNLLETPYDVADFVEDPKLATFASQLSSVMIQNHAAFSLHHLYFLALDTSLTRHHLPEPLLANNQLMNFLLRINRNF